MDSEKKLKKRKNSEAQATASQKDVADQKIADESNEKIVERSSTKKSKQVEQLEVEEIEEETDSLDDWADNEAQEELRKKNQIPKKKKELLMYLVIQLLRIDY